MTFSRILLISSLGLTACNPAYGPKTLSEFCHDTAQCINPYQGFVGNPLWLIGDSIRLECVEKHVSACENQYKGR